MTNETGRSVWVSAKLQFQKKVNPLGTLFVYCSFFFHKIVNTAMIDLKHWELPGSIVYCTLLKVYLPKREFTWH